MRRLRMSSRRRMMLAQVMLGLLLLRAYVPAGFMPQNGNLLQLQLCSGSRSLPAARVLLEQAMGHASHAADCPFSHAPVSGPVGGAVAATSPHADFPVSLPAFDTRFTGVRVLLTHQARAPPLTRLI
jgi:hypothetical protein